MFVKTEDLNSGRWYKAEIQSLRESITLLQSQPSPTSRKKHTPVFMELNEINHYIHIAAVRLKEVMRNRAIRHWLLHILLSVEPSGILILQTHLESVRLNGAAWDGATRLCPPLLLSVFNENCISSSTLQKNVNFLSAWYIHQWNHSVLGFSVLGDFRLSIPTPYLLLVCLDFLFFYDLVLVGCLFKFFFF